MEKLTLREAAKMFDVSRPTLSKALKAGKITGDAVYRDGPESEVIEWRVDPAEMRRVYQPRSADRTTAQPDQSGQLSSSHRPLLDNVQAEIEALKAELAQERAARVAAEHAQALADQARTFAEKMTEVHAAHLEDMRRLLLAGPQPSPEPAPQQTRRSWWSR